MFKKTPTARLMLHVANLMVIFFILLPVVAVFNYPTLEDLAAHLEAYAEPDMEGLGVHHAKG